MNTNTSSATQTDPIGSMIIKDIVLNNFKAAGVMEKYGIDFCCNGKRPLEEALKEKKIDVNSFMNELGKTIDEKETYGERAEDWDFDLSLSIYSEQPSFLRTESCTQY